MEKDTYLHLRNEVEQGREDVFVSHPATAEGGVVLLCEDDQLIVKTADGAARRWDYRECEEILSRREIFPYR